MTRKDYVLIAGVIAKLNPISPNAKGYKVALVSHFVEQLERTNDRFDAERFIKACGD